jgi:hypothetical protein
MPPWELGMLIPYIYFFLTWWDSQTISHFFSHRDYSPSTIVPWSIAAAPIGMDKHECRTSHCKDTWWRRAKADFRPRRTPYSRGARPAVLPFVRNYVFLYENHSPSAYDFVYENFTRKSYFCTKNGFLAECRLFVQWFLGVSRGVSTVVSPRRLGT